MPKDQSEDQTYYQAHREERCRYQRRYSHNVRTPRRRAENKALTEAAIQARREYQSRYYQANIEKARAYQRDYNKAHPKKKCGKTSRSAFIRPRDDKKMAFNFHDIMDRYMHGNKFADVCNKIIADELVFSI